MVRSPTFVVIYVLLKLILDVFGKLGHDLERLGMRTIGYNNKKKSPSTGNPIVNLCLLWTGKSPLNTNSSLSACS